jgi:hypothetical protein
MPNNLPASPVDTTNAPVTGDLQQTPQNMQPNLTSQEQMMAAETQGASAPPIGTTPGPAPVPGTPAAAAQHHGVLGEIFQTLAGGKKKEWQQTESGPVATYRDLKPGEMARGILAAAITGLAGGYDPANRGRGPAMSAAFSGGFKAEQQAREKQEAGAEQEAQQQFKNAGASQERMLAAHRDALAQQEGIRAAQEFDLKQQSMKDQIARGERLDAQALADRDALDMTKLLDMENSRGTQVTGADGKPLIFGSPHDLMEYVNASPANHARAFGTDSFMNTVPLRDPRDNKWYIYQRPIDDHTERWMGVELDPKTHEPIKNKNGDMVADKNNPWYGPDGKPHVPPGKMTPAQFNADNRSSQLVRAEELKNSLTSEQIALDNERLKREQKADNALTIANQHLAEAGDDINGINPTTKLPWVTRDDRNALQNELTPQVVGLTKFMDQLDKEIKELQDVDPKDPLVKEKKAASSDALGELRQLTVKQKALSTGSSDAIADNMRKTHGDDTEAIKKDISKLSPGMQKTVLEKIKTPPANEELESAMRADPKLKISVDHLDKAKPEDRLAQIQDSINKGYLNNSQAGLLAKRYNLQLSAAASAPDVSKFSPTPADIIQQNLNNPNRTDIGVPPAL